MTKSEERVKSDEVVRRLESEEEYSWMMEGKWRWRTSEEEQRVRRRGISGVEDFCVSLWFFYPMLLSVLLLRLHLQICLVQQSQLVLTVVLVTKKRFTPHKTFEPTFKFRDSRGKGRTTTLRRNDDQWLKTWSTGRAAWSAIERHLVDSDIFFQDPRRLSLTTTLNAASIWWILIRMMVYGSSRPTKFNRRSWPSYHFLKTFVRRTSRASIATGGVL